jgi:hypothetical protein
MKHMNAMYRPNAALVGINHCSSLYVEEREKYEMKLN